MFKIAWDEDRRSGAATFGLGGRRVAAVKVRTEVAPVASLGARVSAAEGVATVRAVLGAQVEVELDVGRSVASRVAGLCRAAEAGVLFDTGGFDGPLLRAYTEVGSGERIASGFLWDILFGRADAARRMEHARAVEVPLPERSYPGEATVTEVTLRRPRWPGVWATDRWTTVRVDGGVPTPPCVELPDMRYVVVAGEATREASAPGADFHAAVVAFVARVTAARLRYGGSRWQPSRPQGGGAGRVEGGAA